jgi:integrase
MFPQIKFHLILASIVLILVSIGVTSNAHAVFGLSKCERLAKAMKSARKRAGLSDKGITPHSLRRAGGTEYGNCGANLTEVKDFIRDSSTNAALRYIQSTNRTIGLAESMQAPFASGENT